MRCHLACARPGTGHFSALVAPVLPGISSGKCWPHQPQTAINDTSAGQSSPEKEDYLLIPLPSNNRIDLVGLSYTCPRPKNLWCVARGTWWHLDTRKSFVCGSANGNRTRI